MAAMKTLRALQLSCLFALLIGGPIRAEPDVEQFFSGLLELSARIPTSAVSAEYLGTERTGNAIVLDASGLCVTIGYLVLQAEAVHLSLQDGSTHLAEVLGVDSDSGLAFLRLPRGLVADKRIRPVRLASAPTSTGTEAVVVDYRGHRAATAVDITGIEPFSGSYEWSLQSAIRTRPFFEPFSGAALIDRESRLLGIGALRLDVSHNSDRDRRPGNLFVPAASLPQLIAELLIDNRFRANDRSWLGLNLRVQQQSITIEGVLPGSPAAVGGLKAADEILAMDGYRVRDNHEFLQRLWREVSPQQTVQFLISRNNRILTREVIVADIAHSASLYATTVGREP